MKILEWIGTASLLIALCIWAAQLCAWLMRRAQRPEDPGAWMDSDMAMAYALHQNHQARRCPICGVSQLGVSIGRSAGLHECAHSARFTA